MVLCTLLAAAGEGGQVYLIQPLLNRVLLRRGEADGEAADGEWLAARAARHQAEVATALRAAEAAAVASGALPLAELRRMGGRTAPEAWERQPVPRLLERTRQVLVRTAHSLEPAEQAARARVGQAARLQQAAERRLLVAPARLSERAQDQVVAASLSLEARDWARRAALDSALETLRWVLALALGLAVVLAGARYVEVSTSRLIVAKIMFDLQVDVVRHVLSLSAGQLVSGRRGDLLSRLNVDLERTVSGVVQPLTAMLLVQPLRLAVLLTLALLVAPVLCVALLGLSFTVILPVRIGARRIGAGAERRQSALAEVLEAFHQLFGGVRVVKAFRREDHERQRFRARTREAYKAQKQVVAARAGARVWLGLINDVTVPVVVLVGGTLVLEGWFGLDAGRFLVFALLVVLMYRPTRSLAMAWANLHDALPSLVRLQEVLRTTPAIVDAPDAAPLEALREGVRFDGVWFSYDDATMVLTDVSFEAPVGTTTAIVGHTGAGKSTLMDLLARHLDPTHGGVRVDGRDLRQVPLSSWLSQLAVVNQATFLFNDSVRENIRYGRLDASDAEVEEAARIARVHDEVCELPGGYGYRVGERGSKLSGGQAQRVALARAVVRGAGVLLLDEASSALDARTEQLIQEALAEVQRRCTTFVIAHRLSTVRHADQILVLDAGRLIERGTHQELLAQGGRYAELLHQLQHDRPPAAEQPGQAPILHIVSQADWAAAQEAGRYAPPSLAAEGFIHFSTAEQVVPTAQRYYAGQSGLLLLRVDAPGATGAELRWEDTTGRGERFPHLYGPLPLEAVTAVLPFEPTAEGGFELPEGARRQDRQVGEA